MNEKRELLHITQYVIPEHFFEGLEKGLMTKPLSYKNESEIRIIVTPMFSNKSRDGFILNESNGEDLINMNMKKGLVSLYPNNN